MNHLTAQEVAALLDPTPPEDYRCPVCGAEVIGPGQLCPRDQEAD